jgi:uncharacterized membrane protein YGL010W
VRRPAAGQHRAHGGGTGGYAIAPPERIDALLAEYGAAHGARGNVVCHMVGITLIVFGALSLAHAVHLVGGWSGSEAVVALAGAAYLALDVPLGIAMLGAAVLADLAARAVDDPRVGAAAFVLGWIFQAIGHAVYEKNSPAFFRNLVHLLVGPAYLVNKVLRIRRPAAAS